MTIRMTGLMSGLDTDSIIKELMSAQSLKKTKIENKKTKLEWKQDKWKELNTKLYALYTKQVSKMKLQGSYMTKKVTSSNESAVTATATSSAASGSHTLEVKSLASSQYVTGNQITGATSKSKLTDLGMKEGTTIEIEVGDTKKTMTVGADTTIADFVKGLQGAGLNASFDEKQGRFFISSKESGSANSFSISTTTVAEGSALGTAKEKLKTALGANASSLDDFYDNYGTALSEKAEKQKAYDAVKNDNKVSDADKVTAWEELKKVEKAVADLEDNLTKLATDAKEKELTEDATKEVKEDYEKLLKPDSEEEFKTTYKKFLPSDSSGISELEYQEKYREYQAIYEEVETAVDKSYYKYDEEGNLLDGNKSFTDDVLDKAKEAIRAEAKENINKKIAGGENYADEAARQQAIDEEYDRLVAERGGEEAAKTTKAQEMYEASLASAVSAKASEYVTSDSGKKEIEKRMENSNVKDAIDAAGKEVTNAIADYKAALQSGESATATVSGQLEKLGLTNIAKDTKPEDVKEEVSLVRAADAEIILDGATLTGSSNTFTAAGVTLELKGVTTTTGPVTLNVSNDVDAVYDSIKGFLKEYNSILEEMNTLYNASSAKGYDPLTSEEKEAMTEEQIELWENKIKDSLLRRDTTLGGIADAMRSVMQTTVEVDGKKYSLASYGIMTSSDYTERGLLHIYGDEDDSVYSDQTDKLKAALNEDPDTVTKVFSTIMTKLSDTLMDKMKKTSLSSALTFYNDIQIKNELEDYEDEIDKWEDKLQDMEDRYYKQFSAMETALSKLNSQSSYLSSLMGTSS